MIVACHPDYEGNDGKLVEGYDEECQNEAIYSLGFGKGNGLCQACKDRIEIDNQEGHIGKFIGCDITHIYTGEKLFDYKAWKNQQG